MTDIHKGARARFVLPPGRVLRVSSATSANVKAGSASVVTVTANTQDFGPYAVQTVCLIEAVGGRAMFDQLARDLREVVVAASVPSNNDGRENGTVYLPS